jgi:hypothetical protein
MGPAIPPDLGTLMADVKARTATAPFEVQQHALSLVVQNYHEQLAATEIARQDLGRTVSNLSAGYERGITDPPIPEDQIRALYPTAQADQMVNELKLTQTAGLAFKSVQSATPDEEATARSTLAVPGALAGTASVNGGEAPADTPDMIRLRTQLTGRIDQLLAAKHAALASDPAAYVASLPDIQARAKAVDPSDPATLSAYVTASLAMQGRLGVPDYA